MQARKWTIGVRVDELDVATFEDLGFTNYEDGLMDADIAVDAFWSIAQNVNGMQPPNGSATVSTAPPLIYPGAVLTYNAFYVKGAGQGAANGLGQTGGEASVYFYFPTIKIFSAVNDAEVRNTLNVSFTAKNLGRFLMPGQIDSGNPRGLWK